MISIPLSKASWRHAEYADILETRIIWNARPSGKSVPDRFYVEHGERILTKVYQPEDKEPEPVPAPKTGDLVWLEVGDIPDRPKLAKSYLARALDEPKVPPALIQKLIDYWNADPNSIVLLELTDEGYEWPDLNKPPKKP